MRRFKAYRMDARCQDLSNLCRQVLRRRRYERPFLHKHEMGRQAHSAQLCGRRPERYYGKVGLYPVAGNELHLSDADFQIGVQPQIRYLRLLRDRPHVRGQSRVKTADNRSSRTRHKGNLGCGFQSLQQPFAAIQGRVDKQRQIDLSRMVRDRRISTVTV